MTYYVFVLVFASAVVCFANGGEHPSALSATRTDEQTKLEKLAADSEKVKAKQEALSKAKAALEEQIEKITLPDDTTPRFTVKEIRIAGNTLITTDELFAQMPLVYNTSEQPLNVAESKYLYDFRPLHDIIVNPGQPQQVSARTIQGFTQYLLSVYNRKNYAGIYVYVPAGAMVDGAFKDQILPVEILEASISDISITFHDPNQNKVDKGHLRRSVIQDWSPVKVGQVANQKTLDFFVNLLNLNPDRYVSAVVSRGTEPNTLALQYDIYETSPWHYFIQVDNSGTHDRQWNPRFGFINTNLTGRDDKLNVLAQVPVEEGIEDNYSIYGSYDTPLWTPWLRLTLFGARSEYEVDGGGGIDFLGNGYAYGGKLRWNVFQKKGWFFDLTTSLTREKSQVTTTLFPQFLASKVYLDLWGIGLEANRRSDMANTSIALDRIQNIGGSSQKRFWDPDTLTGARNGAERDFAIVTLAANHSQFLDTSKVQRLLGSLKYIWPDERLVPAMMTMFGGMYSVRGYEENRIVADGGILGSIQYEYDLVRKNQAGRAAPERSQAAKGELKKVAPLAFFDYGRAETKNHVAGERGIEEFCSLGLGMIVEYGEHFNVGIYYGHPLRSAGPTDKGDGRVNMGFTMRF